MEVKPPEVGNLDFPNRITTKTSGSFVLSYEAANSLSIICGLPRGLAEER